MRVQESFKAYSQAFQIWQSYFGVKSAWGLSVGIDFHDTCPTPNFSFPVSHQALLFFPLKCICMFFQTNLPITARLLFLKYQLDPVPSLLQNLSVLSTITGSSADTPSSNTLNSEMSPVHLKNICSSQLVGPRTITIWDTIFWNLPYFPKPDNPPETPLPFSFPFTSLQQSLSSFQCTWD